MELIPQSEFARADGDLALLADMCRANALVAVKRAGSGHLGSSFSAMDVVVHLFFAELNTAELGFRLTGPTTITCPGTATGSDSCELSDVPPRHPIRLGLRQTGPWVLCAVADPSQAVPVPRVPGSFAETGRGLHIIRALSDTWGYTTPDASGKVVWATFTYR